MSEDSRAVSLAAVLLLVVVGMGLGFAAAAMPADEGSGTEAEFELTTADNESSLDVDDLQQSIESSGSEVDRTLLEKTGETVVVLDVERDIDIGLSPMGADATAAMQADSEATLEPVAQEIAEFEGATVRNELWVGNLLTVSVDLDRHDIGELATLDGVNRVVPNVAFERPDPLTESDGVAVEQTAGYTYGLEQLDVPGFEAEFDGERGANATIAIVDDGLSNPDEGHPDLNISQKFLIQDGEVTEGEVLPGAHGEHVAGTAAGAAEPAGDVPRYGVAPEAELLKIDVFGDGLGATFEDIAIGLTLSANEGADVAGFSLGAASDAFDESTFDPTFTDVVEDANAAGTVVSVAVGNEGTGDSGGQVTSPGTQFDSFTVGAADWERDIAPFSSGAIVRNNTIRTFDGSLGGLPETLPRPFVKPDVSAAGASVLSAGPLGERVDDEVVYSYASGTSMAQPHVAGAVALIQSATEADLTPKQIESALAETAEKPAEADFPGIGERDIRYGTGIINVTAATLAAGEIETVEGTVVAASGNEPEAETEHGIVGASVESNTGALTASGEAGEYTLEVTGDADTVTADAFGFSPETVTIAEADEIVLDRTLAVELREDQQPFATFDGEFDARLELANLETYTVELTDNSTVDPALLDVTFAGEPVEIGEPLEFAEPFSAGVAELEVDVTSGDIEEGDIVELSHTFAGFGDEENVVTGPTELTEELDPPAFELQNIDAPETLLVDDPIAVEVEVVNTGQQTGATGIQWFVSDRETGAAVPADEIVVGAGETVTYDIVVDGVGEAFGPGVILTHGFEIGEFDEESGTVADPVDVITDFVAVQLEGEAALVVDLGAPVDAAGGDEIGASAFVANIGSEVADQNAVVVFDGEPVDGALENIELQPFEWSGNVDGDGEPIPADGFADGVLFENVELPDVGLGPENIFDHGVATEDDVRLTNIAVGLDLTGNGERAKDLTGDRLIDDVAGNDELGIADVQALFENLGNEVVQDNANLFDFAGTNPDRLSIFDIQALFNRYQAQFAR